MVRLEGFEPPTVRVEAEYSNPLSYSRIYLFIHKRRFLSYPLNERQKLWSIDVEPGERYSGVCLTMQKVFSDAARSEIVTDALDDIFIVEWFTTEHIKICCAVEFHEMTADVACGDQLHQAVALLGVTFKEILHYRLTVRLHVYSDNKVLDKLYNLSSDGDVFIASCAI